MPKETGSLKWISEHKVGPYHFKDWKPAHYHNSHLVPKCLPVSLLSFAMKIFILNFILLSANHFEMQKVKLLVFLYSIPALQTTFPVAFWFLCLTSSLCSLSSSQLRSSPLLWHPASIYLKACSTTHTRVTLQYFWGSLQCKGWVSEVPDTPCAAIPSVYVPLLAGCCSALLSLDGNLKVVLQQQSFGRWWCSLWAAFI